jgi:hypothetical protein
VRLPPWWRERPLWTALNSDGTNGCTLMVERSDVVSGAGYVRNSQSATVLSLPGMWRIWKVWLQI